MTVLGVLNALVAIPQIAGYVESFATQVVLWYCQRATNTTLAAIADAAALGAKAQTTEDRYAVAQAWATALSQPRVTPH